jgi:hypothetical protein
MSVDTPPKFLTNEQIDKLVVNAALMGDKEGLTEADAAIILRWAEQTMLNNSLLDLALKGLIGLAVKGEETTFTSLKPSEFSKLTKAYRQLGTYEIKDVSEAEWPDLEHEQGE